MSRVLEWFAYLILVLSLAFGGGWFWWFVTGEPSVGVLWGLLALMSGVVAIASADIKLLEGGSR